MAQNPDVLLPGELAAAPDAQTPAPASPEARRVTELLAEALAPATRRAYASDLTYFWAWADLAAPEQPQERYPVAGPVVLRFVLHHMDEMPADVDRELQARGAKASPGPHAPPTVARRLAALGTAHRILGLDDPTRDHQVRQLLTAGRRRAVRDGWSPDRKRAMTQDILEALLATCEDDLAGLRDRALLLVGWASGGRRRSELADARVRDLEDVPDGWVLNLGRTKTSQDGQGHRVPILGRAAAALRAWLDALEDEGEDAREGRLFRRVDRWGHVGPSMTPRAIADMIQRRAAAAGHDPKTFAGHSVRRGFMTETGRRGIPLRAAMQLSGHRSVPVALSYQEEGEVVVNPAARMADS